MIQKHLTSGVIADFANYQGEGWAPLSENEINDYNLQKEKSIKIKTLKETRERANLENMVSHQAVELLLDENGLPAIFAEPKYFAFNVKPTANPASEPNSILFAAILGASANPNYYLAYSCVIIEGEVTRKGYVAINGLVATSLLEHAALRNTTNIRLCNLKEAAINACGTIEELAAIDATTLV